MTLILIYATYYLEKKQKQEFIHEHQLRKMSDEMQNMLSNLPEGIVLIDKETNKVVFTN